MVHHLDWYRLWGDINRIQDIVDSGCVDSSPPDAREDLDWFFAHEVDAHIVQCLERLGVQAVYEPAVEIGIGFEGEVPSDEQMTAAFMETYDWYRLPRTNAPQGRSGRRTDIGRSAYSA